MKKFLIIICAILIAAGLFFTPAVFSAAPKGKDGKIEFYVFDVGQGDSMLFRLPDGKAILIDGGTRDAGEKVVQKLHALGVAKIDLLIATHPHEDHMGGLSQVLNSFAVSKIWDSGYNLGSSVQKKFLETVHRKKIDFEIVKAGRSENIGEVFVEVLAPVKFIKTKQSEANNNCIIARASWKNVSFLLMGDAEIEERKTVSGYPRSTVIKLAHHGSSNGTNQFLLRGAAPKIALVSYAKNNSYGHPHKEVLKLLKENNIPLYATENGDIVVTSAGKEIAVKYENVRGEDFLDAIKNFFYRLFK